MILIFSQKFEPSTSHVIDWLARDNHQFFRLNSEESQMQEINVRISSTTSGWHLVNRNKSIDLEKIKSYWYRRGGFQSSHTIHSSLKKIFPLSFFNAVSYSLREEMFHLTEFIYHLLKGKRRIGDPFKSSPNKLIVLKMAADLGLKIPDTLITNNYDSLLNYFNKLGSVVTKPIVSTFIRDKQKTGHFFAYTELLDAETLSRLPKSFFASKFQLCIDKDYELRIFYLDKKFFSMAIFSQSDEQTKIDFRKYNLIRPNRTNLYSLPKTIESKLILLMKQLELESGSIDMIVTKAGEYIFLEVNPVGQFGMVSEPCNYYIEKEIAEYLSNKK